MGCRTCTIFHFGSSNIISDGNPASADLLTAAWRKIDTAYRPSTTAAHNTHFRTFLAYLIFMGLPIKINTYNVLTFIEYLHSNALSHKVISNYVSSLVTMAHKYGIEHSALRDSCVIRLLRSISINTKFSPTPRGIFDPKTLYLLSMSCDILSDPLLYRAIFLTAYYGFLRMSNVAPHSAAKFDPSVHILSKDLIFAPPGAHLLLKWTKTLQDHKSFHIVQLPSIDNIYLCPVRALKALITSRPTPSAAPLFANILPPHRQVIDTHIRDALRKVLLHRNIPLKPHGFHTFRRSGATFAFDHNVALQNIMAHGLWRSSAIWIYLQNASQAASIIPQTFTYNIPSSF